ncbi:helix-turn-helix domain-containing protein [Streptomyces sp. NPDC016845]|uniref:helix-turn-helix domain-containing protein n=1 Tax=Streptomyces sp. NPDC016845 TaxID=3364972 RepID=UPI00379080B2
MARVDSTAESTDEPGWDVDPDDEQGAAIIAMVGQQIRMRREQLGMRAGQLGGAIGYSEDQIYKVESGKRIPKPEFLDGVDQALDAGGLISATKERVAEVRYPKKLRDLAKMESKASELQWYGAHDIHGLLQTEQYMLALFEMRQPAYEEALIKKGVAGRLARQVIFGRCPAPALSFVLEEVALQRPYGGTMVLRGQLERLVELGQLRNVSIQVMPTGREEHAGADGSIEMLKFPDGTAVGRSPGVAGGRPVDEPKHLRILELRYGMIRAQALTPRESLGFIEQRLGET